MRGWANLLGFGWIGWGDGFGLIREVGLMGIVLVLVGN